MVAGSMRHLKTFNCIFIRLLFVMVAVAGKCGLKLQVRGIYFSRKFINDTEGSGMSKFWSVILKAIILIITSYLPASCRRVGSAMHSSRLGLVISAEFLASILKAFLATCGSILVKAGLGQMLNKSVLGWASVWLLFLATLGYALYIMAGGHTSDFPLIGHGLSYFCSWVLHTIAGWTGTPIGGN